MKGKATNIILILALIAGLSLLLYPSISDYWNSFTQSKAISNYSDQISQLDEERYKKYLEDAYAYNESLLKRKKQLYLK